MKPMTVSGQMFVMHLSTAMVHAKCMVKMEMALNHTVQASLWFQESAMDLSAYPLGMAGLMN